MIPTLLGITMVVFAIIRWAPGSPVSSEGLGAGGETSVDANLRKFRTENLGLNKPIPVQYWNWITKVVRLDFGNSMTEFRPISEMIRERIGLTIKMNLVSEFLVYLIAIPLGLLAAQNRFAAPLRRFLFDTGSGWALLVLYSLPAIVVSTFLIVIFSSGGIVDSYLKAHQVTGWSWLIMPIGGTSSRGSEELPLLAYLVDVGRHFILPIITMTIGGLAYMARFSRNTLLENLQADYIRTARAKGVRERAVVYVHALRNSMLGMITILVGILPGMIGGSVIIEYIFGLPGMGQLLYNAVMRRDYATVQALSLVGAVLTLTAVLLADILYAVVDPRVRYD
jgi:peptide/nickel transport system permease protein